ncbi:MAG TPA: Mth938-like domain-containing protein [Alphaproteobacteria bacterium]|nr:Mth938-like domain-containing protein [Alphaproteobacteria bacterium]
MDVTPLIRAGQQVIQSYAAGAFRISGISFDTPVLVSPDKTVEWKGAGSFDDLTLGSFQQMIEGADDIDVVLLGAGSTMKFFNPDLKAQLSAKGLPVDVMDTGAACRTYNVLMAEGRRVVAALLPTEN